MLWLKNWSLNNFHDSVFHQVHGNWAEYIWSLIGKKKTFKPSNWEGDTGDHWIQSQPSLQSAFQNSEGYRETPSQRNQYCGEDKYALLVNFACCGQIETSSFLWLPVDFLLPLLLVNWRSTMLSVFLNLVYEWVLLGMKSVE